MKYTSQTPGAFGLRASSCFRVPVFLPAFSGNNEASIAAGSSTGGGGPVSAMADGSSPLSCNRPTPASWSSSSSVQSYVSLWVAHQTMPRITNKIG